MSDFDEHDEEGSAVVFFGPGGPMTAEQFRQEQDRAQASNEVFWADVRRLLFQELERDQLHTLKHVFRLVADSERSQQWASYFEGLADAGEHVKALSEPVLIPFGQEEGDPAANEGTLWSHRFVLGSTGLCDTCGTLFDSKPHRRWEAGLRGDGSDGVDV